MITLELAVFHPGSLSIAQGATVPRIELCEDYPGGGITPSLEFYHESRKIYGGDVFVMVRPRSGNFVYSHREFATLIHQAEQFLAGGVDGFVTGMLDKGDNIDAKQLRVFMDSCGGLPVTFHRAFDKVPDWRNGLETLIDAGCTRVLTSGGAANAMQGLDRLREMIDYAAGRIIILPGGGVRSTNAQDLVVALACTELHSAAIRPGSLNPVADGTELNVLVSVCTVP